MRSATVAGVPTYIEQRVLQRQHAHCSHGQGFLVSVVLGINGRGREREGGRQPGKIRPLNASESCDHKDSRRPLLPAVRQQRAQKLEEREAAAAAAAASREAGAETGGNAKMTRALHAQGARIAEVL